MKIPTPITIGVAVIGIVGASYFVFHGAGTVVVPEKSASEPSMVPGAEAVRPLATGQSLRTNEIISELVNPPPAENPAPSEPTSAPAPVNETAS